jgi:hypothetical protein
MPAINAINARPLGPFPATPTTLTASDTITFDPRFKQLLVVRNGTAGALTLNIDGDGVTAVLKPGLGSVSVAAGLNIPLAAGETRAVVLSTISDYCQGVVTLTGALGASLQLFNI